MAKNPTIVQLVEINDTGDSCYRMRWPGRALADQAPDWRIINIDSKATERIQLALEADLLIIYQSHDLDLFPLLKRRRELGRKTLVEYNDNFYYPPPESPAAPAWQSPLIWQVYESYMLESDGVIVTGPMLKKVLAKQVTQDFHILENYLPTPPPDFETVFIKPDNKIRIGWAGSVGHMSDLLALRPLLADLLKDERIELCFMGNESIPDHLRFPTHRVHFEPWGSMDQYLNFLQKLHIGIAPLLATPYNDCRSDIKAIELGSRGTVPLLTIAPPYELLLDTLKLDGFRTSAELRKLIKIFIDDPKLLEQTARRCYNYVIKNRLAADNYERLNLYTQLLPSEYSNFAWPVPVGYHEIMGTPQTNSIHSRIIEQIRKHFSDGQIEAGRNLLQRALQDNTASALLALTELNFLHQIKDTNISESLSAYKARFPNDIRFDLFELRLLDEASAQIVAWNDITRKLKHKNPHYASFFHQGVTAAFQQTMVKLNYPTEALKAAEALIKIYPHSPMLLLEVATLCERLGKTAKALTLFSTLRTILESHQQGGTAFTTISGSYVQSWINTLSSLKSKTLRASNTRLD